MLSWVTSHCIFKEWKRCTILQLLWKQFGLPPPPGLPAKGTTMHPQTTLWEQTFLKGKWRITTATVIITDHQSLSHVWLFATPRTAAHQISLSFTNFRSLLKFMSIESVMPSNHLIFCHPLLFLPSIFPSIRVFSNESGLCHRWPKYWSFSFSISPSNEHPGLISL